MRKEFEIQGCIEVPPEVTEDEFWNAFIEFVESKGWSFGGGIQEIQDGYYILAPLCKVLYFSIYSRQEGEQQRWNIYQEFTH